MALFSDKQGVLTPVNEVKIELEKHVQALTEQNLEAVFGLEFVATEFRHNNLRFDTLAFDKEANAFVVIEYKRDRSFSVIDQGYAYLALLLNNKAEFILEYNEKTGKTLTRDSIDWTQSRVIFVANSFTVHQQQAINFKDLPIELWEVKKYENNTFLYHQLKAQDTSESIKTVTTDTTIQKVSSVVKVIGLEDHFAGQRSKTKELYELFRDRTAEIDPALQENPKVHYIGFATGNSGSHTLVYVHVRVGWMRLDIPRIRPEDVNDPDQLLEYKKGSEENKNTPVSQFDLRSEADVDYAIAILRQVYRKFLS
jgi:predicted transport protein